jgi:cyanuric acid amidohydrolase
MQRVQVFNVPMSAPDDVSGLAELLDSGRIAADKIVAIIAKTEGNGRVNDFTRPFAAHTFSEFVGARLGTTPEDVTQRVALVMSGGCEGVMTPHATIFTREDVPGEPGTEKRMAIGVAFSRELTPAEIGRMAQVEAVADAVRTALKNAEIDDVDDVAFVQVKCPLLTPERINQARERGEAVVTTDVVRSLGYSNGASALGVGLALGEIPRERLSDEVICADASLYSSVASSSAGVELMYTEAIVMGNSTRAVGDLRVGSCVMQDLIDADAVRTAMRRAGLEFDGVPGPETTDRIVATFGKGLVAPNGRVRGLRTTLLSDSDLGTRPARAVLNAVLASVVRTPMVYASAGWGYHQGRTGGGLVSVIARVG